MTEVMFAGMSTFDRWSLLIALCGVVINLILFIVFFVQLLSLRQQIKISKDATNLDHERRRSQATIDYYLTTETRRTELRKSLPHDLDDKLIFQKCEEAKTNEVLSSNIAEYLGIFELMAAAVNTGVFDIGITERMASTRIVAIATNYLPWIEWRRKSLGHPRLLADLIAMAHELEGRSARATKDIKYEHTPLDP